MEAFATARDAGEPSETDAAGETSDTDAAAETLAEGAACDTAWALGVTGHASHAAGGHTLATSRWEAARLADRGGGHPCGGGAIGAVRST